MKHFIFVLTILLLIPLRIFALYSMVDFATVSVCSPDNCINVELKRSFENTTNRSLPVMPIIASISENNLLNIELTSLSSDVSIQIITKFGVIYDEFIHAGNSLFHLYPLLILFMEIIK
ncbi:DUF3244 domain-containing protein [Bacteroides neonati]|uniref:DUF3244 domain-containing protein n=1 Tax=Bacteroides neonati TaxID=1347393 RepID=UPI0009444930